MKYQITCAHCNTRFLVDGKGGQTIECECPGCGGKMRVTLPKSEKPDDEPDSDNYQTGYAPPENGDTDNGDNGNEHKSHRGLALGCLLFVVGTAAAVVALMALNHTTKKPIDDPYEYVEPDTTSADSVVEDTVPKEVDTVEVHEEKPKVKAAPVDTTLENSAEASEAGDEDATTDEATTDVGDKSSTKPAATAKDKSSKDKSSKDKSSKTQSTKDNLTTE